MPVIALDTDVGVRLLGRRNRTAASDQYPHHTSCGVTAPPMPCPAAEDAMPTLAPSVALVGRSGTRPGHQADQSVEEHRARGTGEGRSGPGEDQAEPFSEEPDSEGPEERDDKGGSHGPAEQQPQSDGHLNERKKVFQTAASGPRSCRHW